MQIIHAQQMGAEGWGEERQPNCRFSSDPDPFLSPQQHFRRFTKISQKQLKKQKKISIVTVTSTLIAAWIRCKSKAKQTNEKPSSITVSLKDGQGKQTVFPYLGKQNLFSP